MDLPIQSANSLKRWKFRFWLQMKSRQDRFAFKQILQDGFQHSLSTKANHFGVFRPFKVIHAHRNTNVNYKLIINYCNANWMLNKSLLVCYAVQTTLFLCTHSAIPHTLLTKLSTKTTVMHAYLSMFVACLRGLYRMIKKSCNPKENICWRLQCVTIRLG